MKVRANMIVLHATADGMKFSIWQKVYDKYYLRGEMVSFGDRNLKTVFRWLKMKGFEKLKSTCNSMVYTRECA